MKVILVFGALVVMSGSAFAEQAVNQLGSTVGVEELKVVKAESDTAAIPMRSSWRVSRWTTAPRSST